MDNKISRALFICTALTPLFFYPALNSIFILPKYAWIFLTAALLFAVNLKKNFFNSRNVFILPAGVLLLWHFAVLYRCVNVFSGLHSILLLILFITFYITFENLAAENPEHDFLLKSICIVTIAVSAYGLLQAAGYDPFTWEIKQSPLSSLGRRNFAAEYLAAVIPYFYYLIAVAGNRAQKNLWAVILFVVLLHLFFTFTRASWLAFFASTLFFLMLTQKKKILPAGKTAVLLLIFLFLIRPSFSSVRGFEKGTAASRMRIYAVSLEMLKNNPFTGVGPGNFNILYPLYASGMGEKSLRAGELMVMNVHNDFLETAVNLGIPGLLLFLFLLFTAGRVSYLLYKKSQEKEKLFITALMSSVLAISVNSMASFPFKMPATTLLFWMNLALLGALFRQRGRVPQRYNLPALKICFVLFLTAGCVLSYRGLSAGLYAGKAERTKGLPSLQYAERAVRYNPFSYEYNFLAGKYAIEVEEYGKALQYLTKAKKYHPHFNVIYNNLGIVYFSTRRPAQAEEAYLHSIKLNPYHADVYSNLGVLYAQAGRYNEAIEYFHQAVDRKQDFYTACFNLGLAYYFKGDYARARTWFEKTLSIKPGYPPAQEYLNKLP